jgi:hypothetical protein
MYVLNNLRITNGLPSPNALLPSILGEGDYYGCFLNDEHIIGLISHFWNNNLVVNCPDSATLVPLLDLIRARGRNIAGVLGVDPQAVACQKLLGWDLQTEIWSTNSQDQHMRCIINQSKLSAVMENPALTMVQPTEDMMTSFLIDWIIQFEREADDPSVEQAKMRIQSWLDNDTGRPKAWVLKDDANDGNFVSLAGASCRVDELIQIGPVFTPIEHRNKGYAKQLLARMLLHEVEQGWASQAVLMAEDP